MSRFLTHIPARGSDANIYAILANARRLMWQLGVSQDEIDEASSRVRSAASYDDACAVIEEWFPLDRDEDWRIEYWPR